MVVNRKRFGRFVTLSAMLPLAAACRPDDDPAPAKSDPPAKVSHAADEADLATVTLTAHAEARLGIDTASVETRRIQRTRTFGGEILVPTGRRITVQAPLAGTLLPGDSDSALAPGKRMADGQVILRLSPMLYANREVLQPGDRINLARARADLAAAVAEAEGDLSAALVEVEATTIKLQRAQQLVQDEAGSLRAFQEAEAEVQLAQARVKAARRRLEILVSTDLNADPAGIASLPIESPLSGVLQELYALPGDAVASGAALFTVAAFDPVWVRVPVYTGEVASIDKDATAEVTDVRFRPDDFVRRARPVAAPPTADALAATVDLIYELANADATLLPGMRVGVRLQLKSSEDRLVVPWSAVIYDFNGGTWVYVNSGAHTFTRRRVAVQYVTDGMAVLARGLAPGTPVVATGAAELFGTEFGGGK